MLNLKVGILLKLCIICRMLYINKIYFITHWGFLVDLGTTPTVLVSATTRRDGLVGRNRLDPGHFFLQAWLLIWWKRKRFVCETLKPRSGASNWYQICRLLRLVLKVFGSRKAVKLFAAFYCSFCWALLLPLLSHMMKIWNNTIAVYGQKDVKEKLHEDWSYFQDFRPRGCQSAREVERGFQ